MAAAPPLVEVERPRDGVALLWLSRGPQRNALSAALMEAMLAELRSLAEDATAKVVVIGGRGPAFCAGHDLKEMTARRSDPDYGEGFYRHLFTRCAELMQGIVEHPKPVVAMVHGIATAAGCQLVASCDLAVAGESASFATPGVDIGLFCSTPMVALSRAVPRKAALEMLLTGESVGAKRAAEIGLVNRAVPDASLFDATMELASRIASKPRRTLAVGKALFQAQLDRPLGEAYSAAIEAMTRNMLDGEACEGIGAFVEKRAPAWPS